MKPVRILAPAAKEIREAAHFYQTRVFGLGDEFLEEIRATIGRIRVYPEAWVELESGIRRCRTRRFPYGVIYGIIEREIVIISVMHLHRHPRSWRNNLE